MSSRFGGALRQSLGSDLGMLLKTSHPNTTAFETLNHSKSPLLGGTDVWEFVTRHHDQRSPPRMNM
jgi:hypothetical protein